MQTDDRLEQLRSRLRGELPGVSAQLRMAPSIRMNPRLADVSGKPCREAAVLVVLYPEGEGLNLLLTMRPPHMKVHAGQVSFPGGRREKGETLVEAALREAHEEVGLPPDEVEVVGSLTPLYIPPSNFCTYPFVAFCPSLPSLRPQDAEVHAVIHVSVDELFAPEARESGRWHVRGEEMDVPFYRYGPYRIWGATAMMLSELQAVLVDDEQFV